ncbi:MAG: PAS domain-containing sensor histidine kinase [Halobacteriales archaeon]|nr:PAS domain-containing sensor histidine kinase [Halobacteriales archaeon]
MAPGLDAVFAEASGAALLLLGVLFVALRRGRRERFFGVFAVIWGGQVVLANLGRVLESASIHAQVFLLAFALAPPAYLFLGHLAARELPDARGRALTAAWAGLALLAGGVLVLAPSLVVVPSPASFASVLGPASVPLFIAPFFGAFYLAIAAFYAAYRRSASSGDRLRGRAYLQALALFAAYASMRQFFVYLAPPAGSPALDPLAAGVLASFFLGGTLLLLGIAAHLVARPVGASADLTLIAALVLPAGWALTEVLAGQGLLPDSVGLWRLATVATLMFQLHQSELIDAFTSLERKERQLQARIAQAESLNRALHQSEERYRSILESTEVGYCEVDATGSVQFANGTLGSVLGRRPEALVGAALTDLVPDGEGLVRAIARARAADAPVRGLVPQRTSAGQRWLEFAVAPVRDEGPSPGTRCLFRDVTEQHRAEEERRRSEERAAEIARLRDLDRLKTQFINTAAHELCTPLTPIKLQVEMLREGKAAGLTPAQLRSLQILDRNVDRLNDLVADVLAVARLQAGRMTVVQEPMDLRDVVNDAVESFRDVAERAGVRLTAHVERLPVDGDRKRLAQVLFNLVDNAVKFTPRGGSIRVEASAQGQEAVVRVADTGAGIAAEDIARLFQPFTQVHDTSQMTRAGTGLGLFISRGIVELHGGSLGCESAGPGQGTTFTMRLPLLAAAEPARAAVPARGTPPAAP